MRAGSSRQRQAAAGYSGLVLGAARCDGRSLVEGLEQGLERGLEQAAEKALQNNPKHLNAKPEP